MDNTSSLSPAQRDDAIDFMAFVAASPTPHHCVAEVAQRLEQAGYISKQINKTDRRLLHLHLTAEGQSLMTELLPLADRFQQEMETRLGKAFKGLEAGLDKILEDQE